MRTARAFLTLSATTALATAFTTSCGSDEVTGDPGTLGGRTGTAMRGGAGGSGGLAGMRATGGRSASTGGKGGASGTGGAGAKSTNLGRACTDTATCGTTTSLECFNDASIPAGLCSAECTLDSECAALSAGAVCAGFCLEGCTVGPDALNKCHGRPDFSCQLFDSINTGTLCTTDASCEPGSRCSNGTCFRMVTACLPTCASDFDCGAGFCNYGTGLCQAARPAGKPMGSACNVNATAEECSGLCIGDSAGDFSLCSGYCTFGLPQAQGCGWNGEGPADSACLFGPAYIETMGPGDSGYCGQLCDCDSDCRNPDFKCRSFVGEDPMNPENGEPLVALFQRAGYCSLAAPNDITLPECSGGEGGAGGAGGSAGEPGSSAGAGGSDGGAGG